LLRKTGGRCPGCGEVVTAHVARARLRERRIEQAVAIVATVLVVTLFVWGGGMGLVEGVAIYAVVGLVVWYWGRGTFWSATLAPQSDEHPHPDGAATEANTGPEGHPGPHRSRATESEGSEP
jgi:hypothetical protein